MHNHVHLDGLPLMRCLFTVVTSLKKYRTKRKQIIGIFYCWSQKVWEGKFVFYGRRVSLFSLGRDTVNDPRNHMELYFKKRFIQNLQVMRPTPVARCHSTSVCLIHNGFVIIFFTWLLPTVHSNVPGELIAHLLFNA